MSHLAVLVMICTAFLASIASGDEVSGLVTGEVRLGSGRVVESTYHFDRNSLRDSLRSGDGLIALTSSGALLRFELPGIRLVRERIEPEEITCIGRGEGETVLVGLSDGRVCRVDPVTLGLTDMVKLPSAPHWLGWRTSSDRRPAGLIAATTQTKTVERDGRRWDVPVSAVRDVATETIRVLEQKATTFLLDRAGRLWLGADRGEWGGWVARVDLLSGTVVEIKPPRDRSSGRQDHWFGVYGFVERRDGQVLAFGGMSHVGVNSGFIACVDQAESRRLFASEPTNDRDKQPDSSRAWMPITHVVEDGDGFLVLSYSDVFRVDSAFAAWNNVATLKIAYRWGRPDAVGTYPSVLVVHPPPRAGGAYLFATVGDGYVSLEGTKATSHSISGQLGASRIYDIKNTSEGTFFFESDNRLPVWRLDAKGWEIASLAPPMEPDPAGEFAAYE